MHGLSFFERACFLSNFGRVNNRSRNPSRSARLQFASNRLHPTIYVRNNGHREWLNDSNDSTNLFLILSCTIEARLVVAFLTRWNNFQMEGCLYRRSESQSKIIITFTEYIKYAALLLSIINWIIKLRDSELHCMNICLFVCTAGHK